MEPDPPRSIERPLRLAFLDSWPRDASTGTGTAVAIGGLERALRNLGHTVDLPRPVWPWLPSLTLRRLAFNVVLPSRLQWSDYDVVVGFDMDGCFLPTARRGRYVASIKGVLAEEMAFESGRVRKLLGFQMKLERMNVRRSPRVVTTSEYCAASLVTHYGIERERIAIVPEGIDVSFWRDDTGRRLSSVRGTILCVARHYPRKKIDDLIRAFDLLRRRVPTARLVIVGDGPEHRPLRALAASLGSGDRVVFTGSLPDDRQVRDWYRQSDVFCLPSVQEGFGIVFLEAMASGLPIVATRATAVPEVVTDGQTGLLVSPGNVEELARALERVLLDRPLHDRLGGAGYDSVARYDWAAVARRFLHVIPVAGVD